MDAFGVFGRKVVFDGRFVGGGVIEKAVAFEIPNVCFDLAVGIGGGTGENDGIADKNRAGAGGEFGDWESVLAVDDFDGGVVAAVDFVLVGVAHAAVVGDFETEAVGNFLAFAAASADGEASRRRVSDANAELFARVVEVEIPPFVFDDLAVVVGSAENAHVDFGRRNGLAVLVIVDERALDGREIWRFVDDINVDFVFVEFGWVVLVADAKFDGVESFACGAEFAIFVGIAAFGASSEIAEIPLISEVAAGAVGVF